MSQVRGGGPGPVPSATLADAGARRGPWAIRFSHCRSEEVRRSAYGVPSSVAYQRQALVLAVARRPGPAPGAPSPRPCGGAGHAPLAQRFHEPPETVQVPRRAYSYLQVGRDRRVRLARAGGPRVALEQGAGAHDLPQGRPRLLAIRVRNCRSDRVKCRACFRDMRSSSD